MATMKKPDFENFLRVLQRDPAAKPVLFELFLNDTLYCRLAGRDFDRSDPLDRMKITIEAFAAAGYDYATVMGSAFSFPAGEHKKESTYSANEGALITDRASFEAYPWPDPDAFDYSALEAAKDFLPENMKLMVMGAGGVLENVTALTGYDNLCYMLYEDPELLQDIFDAVGSRLVRYYELSAPYDTVGVIMSNDDWGFNTQTFLKTEDMRKYVFPWHRRITETAHKAGKPVLLHSCGYIADVMDDIIDDMHYDGKHSYEDNIIPVEEAYRRWGGRIAILGGIDVDFIIRSSEEAIKSRCESMLRLTAEKGGYALGSGNSVPEYVPAEHYFAMTNTLLARL